MRSEKVACRSSVSKKYSRYTLKYELVVHFKVLIHLVQLITIISKYSEFDCEDTHTIVCESKWNYICQNMSLELHISPSFYWSLVFYLAGGRNPLEAWRWLTVPALSSQDSNIRQHLNTKISKVWYHISFNFRSSPKIVYNSIAKTS